MKLKLLIFLSLIFGSVSAQNLEWAVKIDGSLNEFNYSATIDSQGNVYSVGFFQGVVDFDPGSNVFNLQSNGASDYFITKIDADGNFIWARNLDVTGLSAITLDTNDNIYLAGTFAGTTDFDPGLNVLAMV